MRTASAMQTRPSHRPRRLPGRCRCFRNSGKRTAGKTRSAAGSLGRCRESLRNRVSRGRSAERNRVVLPHLESKLEKRRIISDLEEQGVGAGREALRFQVELVPAGDGVKAEE